MAAAKYRKQHIRKNSGVSIIFALVIFLAASVLSMVIVNAAQANVNRLAREKEQEQIYLTAVSYADFIKTEMADAGVRFRVELKEDGDRFVMPDAAELETVEISYRELVTTSLAPMICSLVQGKLTENNRVQVYEMSLDLIGTPQTAKVTFSMPPGEDDYRIRARIEVKDPTDTDQTVYTMTLVFGSQLSYKDIVTEETILPEPEEDDEESETPEADEEQGAEETEASEEGEETEPEAEIIKHVTRDHTLTWSADAMNVYKGTIY